MCVCVSVYMYYIYMTRLWGFLLRVTGACKCIKRERTPKYYRFNYLLGWGEEQLGFPMSYLSMHPISTLY